MNDDVVRLARVAVREMTPYGSARSITSSGSIFLDANESPWPTYDDDGIGASLNRYPEPQPRELVEQLSRLYGVSANALFVGRGTDDAIDALVRTFCEAGRDRIAICPPTYGMYEVAAAIQGAGVTRITRTGPPPFGIDPEAVVAACGPETKLVFLCSPNNPTGDVVPQSVTLHIARALRGRAIVVVDEAYQEFSDSPSTVPFVARMRNLVALRTLSKAWGLAGARCGVALGDPEVIALLHKVRAPYPLSSPAVRCILRALAAPSGALEGRVEQLRRERDRLASALRALPGVDRVFPSAANFLLIRAADPRGFLQRCHARGIVVRDRSSEPGLAGCIRITVGSAAENDALLDALAENR